MIFAAAAWPIVDALTTLALTSCEVAKGALTLKITDYNNRIQELDNKSSNCSAIGFFAPEEEEKDDEDDD